MKRALSLKIALVACLLAAAASAASWVLVGRDPGLVPRPKAPIKNLIMIVIDTQRTDVLGIYGAKYGASPNIDAFGVKSIVFENAWSQNTYTIGSFMSFMTSTHLRTHGLDANLGRGGICAWGDVRTLPEVLKDHGFTTRAYVANPNLHPKKGFARGFDTWNDQTDEDLKGTRKSSMSDQGVVRRATRDLSSWKNERNFLYLHLMAPHLPQHPSKQAINRFKLDKKSAVVDLELINQWRRHSTPEQQELSKRVYVASVWDGDRLTGAILEAIKQTGHHQDSVVLLMSDHGEELWEHGDYGHQDGVWEQLAHVPLILHLPNAPATRVSEPVALIDVLPTMLDLLGIDEQHPSWQGQHLFESHRQPVFVQRFDEMALTADGRQKTAWYWTDEPERQSESNNWGKPAKRRTVRHRTPNLDNNEWHFFDLTADPTEQNPSFEGPKALRDHYADWLARTPVAPERDNNAEPIGICSDLSEAEEAEHIEVLRELGYVE